MSGPAGEDDAVPITAELIEDTVQQILALANYEEDTGLTAKRAEIVDGFDQPSEASGHSAQDRYVARSSGGVSRKRGRNGEE